MAAVIQLCEDMTEGALARTIISGLLYISTGRIKLLSSSNSRV